MTHGRTPPHLSRRAIILGAASAVGLASPTILLARRAIDLAVPEAYPFSRMDSGQPRGLIAEPLVWALAQIGQPVRYVQMSIDEIYASVETGAIDAGCVMTAIGDRSDRAIYTRPIVTEYSVCLMNRDHQRPLQTLSDLKKLRLGGRTGFVYDALDDATADRMQRSPVDADIIRGLLLGDLDVGVIGGIKVLYELRAEGVMRHLHNTGVAVGSVGLGAAFAKGPTGRDLQPRINAALDRYLSGPLWPRLVDRHAARQVVRRYPFL